MVDLSFLFFFPSKSKEFSANRYLQSHIGNKKEPLKVCLNTFFIHNKNKNTKYMKFDLLTDKSGLRRTFLFFALDDGVEQRVLLISVDFDLKVSVIWLTKSSILLMRSSNRENESKSFFVILSSNCFNFANISSENMVALPSSISTLDATESTLLPTSLIALRICLNSPGFGGITISKQKLHSLTTVKSEEKKILTKSMSRHVHFIKYNSFTDWLFPNVIINKIKTKLSLVNMY